jgi:hypothetical protein
MMLTTQQQRDALKAYIESVPEWMAQPHNGDGAYFVAQELNKDAAPAFIVWKSSVSVDEIMRNGMDWARVDNLTVGKARIWDWLGRLGTFDASKTNVRAGIDAAWVGTVADLAVRASIYTHCKRNSNVVEKLMASGTGTDAAPATMACEGSIGYQEVADVMRW